MVDYLFYNSINNIDKDILLVKTKLNDYFLPTWKLV